VNRVKGRLQYTVRQTLPRALQRNYSSSSFGSATRTAGEHYVASQLEHHRMADTRVQAMLECFQIVHEDVDLARARSTAHGIYWYNLHLVLVHRERWAEIREPVLERLRDMIEGVCRKKGHFSLDATGVGREDCRKQMPA
jgi:hypothetical protein